MPHSRKRRRKPERPPALDRNGLRRFLGAMSEEGTLDELLDRIEEVARDAADPGGDLAVLAAYDLDKAISRRASFLLFQALQVEEVPRRIQDRFRRTAAPALLKALQDPALPDERKTYLASLYKLCGGDLSLDQMQSFFRDFEGSARQTLEEISAGHSDQPEGVAELFDHLDFFGPQGGPPGEDRLGMALALGLDMRETNPTLAASLLGTLFAVAAEHHVTPDRLGVLLETIAQTHNERASWCLAELGRWPGLGPLGAQARTLAADLSAAGVAPRFTLLADFSHGLASAVDGVGSRSVSLFFRTPEGGMDAVMLVLNDGRGVKDAWFVFGEGGDVESQLRDASPQIPYAPCTVELARELLADAWAIHERSETPLPGRLFIGRPYLGGEGLLPKRRTPNLGAYMLETLVRSPELVKGSERLADSDQYGVLNPTPDAGYQFLTEVGAEPGRRLSEEHFQTFVRDIAPLERELLLSRMAANLEVESLAGRATQPLNRLAARTWVALTENLVPFHEVPFVRSLCEYSVGMISQNLRLGFRTQADANRADLDRDLEDQDAADFLDDWEEDDSDEE